MTNNPQELPAEKPALPKGQRPALLFAFAALVAVADLGSKAWAGAVLASPVHPMVWADAAGKTPLQLLADRGIGAQEAAKINGNLALLRMQPATLKADAVIGPELLGKQLVVADGSGFAAPRAMRFGNRHAGKTVAEAVAEPFRVDAADAQQVLKTAWFASNDALQLDKPLGAGEALGVFERHIELVPDWLSFVYAENPGAAFSFLVNAPAVVRHLLFTVISSLASLGLCWWLWKGNAGSTLAAWALAGILGGAIGNVVDRVHYHVVIDFIYMYFTGADGRVHGWPVYNIADIGVTVGVVLIAGESIFRRQPAAAPTAAKA